MRPVGVESVSAGNVGVEEDDRSLGKVRGSDFRYRAQVANVKGREKGMDGRAPT